MLLGLLVLPRGEGGEGFLVGFFDNTEHAFLPEAFAECFLSAFLSMSHVTPPPVLPPKHLLLGFLTSSVFLQGGQGGGWVSLCSLG